MNWTVFHSNALFQFRFKISNALISKIFSKKMLCQTLLVLMVAIFLDKSKAIFTNQFNFHINQVLSLLQKKAK